MNAKSLLAAAIAAFTLTTAASADKVRVYRDLDGDGHYNKKTYDVRDRHHRHYRGHRHHYHRGHRHYYHGHRHYYRYPRYYSHPRYYYHRRPGVTFSFRL